MAAEAIRDKGALEIASWHCGGNHSPNGQNYKSELRKLVPFLGREARVLSGNQVHFVSLPSMQTDVRSKSL